MPRRSAVAENEPSKIRVIRQKFATFANVTNFAKLPKLWHHAFRRFRSAAAVKVAAEQAARRRAFRAQSQAALGQVLAARERGVARATKSWEVRLLIF